MPKLNLDDIAGASSGKDFGEFQKNFQEIIANLQVRQKFGGIQTDREYTLDEDGYIVGDVWTEKIASEIMETGKPVIFISICNAVIPLSVPATLKSMSPRKSSIP